MDYIYILTVSKTQAEKCKRIGTGDFLTLFTGRF